jgi:hypothetical protein
MEHYNTFKEIDTRLKILRLQKEISLEQLHFHRQKINTHLRPAALSRQFGEHIKRTAFFFLAGFLLKKLRSLSTSKSLDH